MPIFAVNIVARVCCTVGVLAASFEEAERFAWFPDKVTHSENFTVLDVESVEPIIFARLKAN